MINKLKTLILSLLFFSLFGCSDNKSKELASDIAFVDSLMSRMTLEEKLGQMTQVDRQFLSDISDISKYGLGSLLSGGGSTPDITLPSRAISIHVDTKSTSSIEQLLRAHTPPIIGRIDHDELLLDLLTVDPKDDEIIVAAVTRLVTS